MSIRTVLATAFSAALACFSIPGEAQQLDPHIRKIADGIYVYVGTDFGPACKSANCIESNAGIVLTQEGVVLIDTGQNPTDSRAILQAVRTLSSLPVKYILHTEPHPDHTTGDFLFAPPATVISHQGAAQEMKSRDPARVAKLAATSPEMAEAAKGYRMVLPDIEFEGRRTVSVGERTFELFHLKNVHSEADVAVWLPKERVLFSASGAVVKQWNVFRPFVGIPDILAATKMLMALKPEFVIPGHGAPGTAKIFADTEAHYALVLERVSQMKREGKSLDQIKKEARFPEYADWINGDRIPAVIDAANRALDGK